MRRQSNHIHQLVRYQPFVHLTHSLVVDILDTVPIIEQDLLNIFNAYHRQPVSRHHCGGVEAPQPVDALVPVDRISEGFAPQGLEHWKCLGRDHLGGEQDAALGQKDRDLIGRLARHVHELHRDAGDSDIERVSGEFPSDRDGITVLEALLAPLFVRVLLNRPLSDWPRNEMLDLLLNSYATPRN